jgi:hypothetical protein
MIAELKKPTTFLAPPGKLKSKQTEEKLVCAAGISVSGSFLINTLTYPSGRYTEQKQEPDEEFKRKRREEERNIAARSCRRCCNLVGLVVRDAPHRRGLVDVSRRAPKKHRRRRRLP